MTVKTVAVDFVAVTQLWIMYRQGAVLLLREAKKVILPRLTVTKVKKQGDTSLEGSMLSLRCRVPRDRGRTGSLCLMGSCFTEQVHIQDASLHCPIWDMGTESP